MEYMENEDFFNMSIEERKAAFQIKIQEPHPEELKQKQFDVRQFIIKNFSNRTGQEVFPEQPIAQRVFLNDGSEIIVWYDLRTDLIKTMDIGVVVASVSCTEK